MIYLAIAIYLMMVAIALSCFVMAGRADRQDQALEDANFLRSMK